MALCDYLIGKDIKGYDCADPPVKGVESLGYLINRRDIDYSTLYVADNFFITFEPKSGATAYKVYQSGKTPFNGTQQEMAEGANANTFTNTLQLVVLKQDKDWAQQLFSLVNGEFVAILKNRQSNDLPSVGSNYQVFGFEAGLHCTGAVRELYSDDNLSGWVITFVEEGATKGNLFTDSSFLTDWFEE